MDSSYQTIVSNRLTLCYDPVKFDKKIRTKKNILQPKAPSYGVKSKDIT